MPFPMVRIRWPMKFQSERQRRINQNASDVVLRIIRCGDAIYHFSGYWRLEIDPLMKKGDICPRQRVGCTASEITCFCIGKTPMVAARNSDEGHPSYPVPRYSEAEWRRKWETALPDGVFTTTEFGQVLETHAKSNHHSLYQRYTVALQAQ